MGLWNRRKGRPGNREFVPGVSPVAQGQVAMSVLPSDPAELDQLAARLRAEGYAQGKTALLMSGESLDWLGMQLVNRGYMAEAETAFRQSARLGYPVGLYNYALTCVAGGRIGEAREAYKQAADADLPKAMNNLADLMARAGELDVALGWLRRAAAAGDPDAVGNIPVVEGFLAARAQIPELGTPPADLDPQAAYQLGMFAEYRSDVADAVRWYCFAGEAGHVEAANRAAELIDGCGDEQAAMPWYERAAAAGFAPAMLNLGVCYANRGDLTAAERWYRAAAEVGYVKAQTNLGDLLAERGETVEALTWFTRANEAGDEIAGQALEWYGSS